ncbi:MAG: helix-turn-helix domain-containing protein [Bacteroidota bacterium]
MLNLINYLPEDPLLKEIIEYYYFLSSEEETTHEQFIHFPHYRTTLNIYFNAKVVLNEKKRTIINEPKNLTQTVFTNNKTAFKEAEICGPYNIIGVIFKPLGINHFIEQNLASLSSETSIFLNNYWNGFEKAMLHIDKKNSFQQKALSLDALFRSYYRPFDQPTLIQIVASIMRSKGSCTVHELALQFNINRRTILRLFKKHLNCSIADFRRIVKFRLSLDAYKQATSQLSLTQLSHNHEYYDQSDFINHFKSITGGIPSKLLRQIMQVDQQDIYWKMKE